MPSPTAAQALSYRQARDMVVRELTATPVLHAVESVPLDAAEGRVLAQDLHADRDYPSLDRTARDGFAVRSSDFPGRARVIGEVRAGEYFTGNVHSGETVEIMTGAPIPAGANSIIMVEHVTRETNTDGTDFIAFAGDAPVGQFINVRGGEAHAGALLLSAGTRLGYTEIGLLAMLGCVQPPVFARPRVAILATGDELVPPDCKPEPNQIRNSNAWSLAAQVRRAGGVPEILGIASDRESETREFIELGLTSDLLLLSGGVSAGKYDLVEPALSAAGAEFFFNRIAIQPGAPLVFGRARQRFLFGLPGNPASTIVTFELFARTALEVLAGQPAREPIFLEARLTRDYRHRPGLTRFLPASISPAGDVTPIAWTGSSDIASLTRANAFMVVDSDRSEWKAGDAIPVLLK